MYVCVVVVNCMLSSGQGTVQCRWQADSVVLKKCADLFGFVIDLWGSPALCTQVVDGDEMGNVGWQ